MCLPIYTCITETSKIAPLRSAGPPYALLQSAFYVGVRCLNDDNSYETGLG